MWKGETTTRIHFKSARLEGLFRKDFSSMFDEIEERVRGVGEMKD
jgi:hypothetical protein